MMQTHTPTRAEALTLLKAYNSNASLIQHALDVETVMRHTAGNMAQMKTNGVLSG